MIAFRPVATRMDRWLVPAIGRPASDGPLAAGSRPKSASLQIHDRGTNGRAKALPIGVTARYKD